MVLIFNGKLGSTHNRHCCGYVAVVAGAAASAVGKIARKQEQQHQQQGQHHLRTVWIRFLMVIAGE